MTDAEPIRKLISGMLESRLLPADVAPSESLFLSGKLDSVAAVQLIVFLERNYGWESDDTDFSIGKLDTLEKIIRQIER